MRHILRTVTAATLCVLPTGCAFLAAGMYKFGPPPTVPAEYKPPQQPTLVLVENYENPAAMEVPADRLDRDIAHNLKEHKAAPLVEPQQLFDLRDRKGQAFARLNIPEVAREVGARQVIYVNLVRFTAEPDPGSDVFKGEARAMVKVVDATTGRTLWPQNSSAGREVKCETPYLRPETGVDANAVQEKLYQNLGEQVARLFYDWQQTDKVDGSEPDMPAIAKQ